MSTTIPAPSRRKTKVKPCETCGAKIGHVEGCPDQPKAEQDVPTVSTTVDGVEAHVVLDGSEGGPVQPELITTSLEDRVRAIAQKRELLIEAEVEKKRVSERVKTIQGELNAMVDGLVEQVQGKNIPLPSLGAIGIDDQPAREERVDPRFAAMAQEMQAAPDDDGGEDDAIRQLRGRRVAIEAASNEGPED